MLGYTKVIVMKMFGKSLDAKTENIVLRNAIAYELPIARRTAALQSSLRGSYTLTNFEGDQLHAKTYLDVTLSLGVQHGCAQRVRNAAHRAERGKGAGL